MSDRNNQGSGSSWAWIIGTGVAAVAGTVLAMMATNTEPTTTEYTSVPRRQQPPPSLQPRSPSSSTSSQPRSPSSSTSSQIEYDFDDAFSTSSLGEEVDGEPQKLCIICFRHLDKAATRELTCRHLFHSYCIGKWLKKNKECPMCRRPASPEQLDS